MDVYNISNLLAIIGALVVLVNILTEVIKEGYMGQTSHQYCGAYSLRGALRWPPEQLTHRSIPFISHGIW